MARGRKGANGKRRRTPGLSTLSRPLASPIACLYTYLPLSRSLRDPHQESISPSSSFHRQFLTAILLQQPPVAAAVAVPWSHGRRYGHSCSEHGRHDRLRGRHPRQVSLPRGLLLRVRPRLLQWQPRLHGRMAARQPPPRLPRWLRPRVSRLSELAGWLACLLSWVGGWVGCCLLVVCVCGGWS